VETMVPNKPTWARRVTVDPSPAEAENRRWDYVFLASIWWLYRRDSQSPPGI
jgi:hypothetical protein